jgi:hypothetical protein
VDKQIMQWVKQVEKAGAEVKWAGSGHLKLRCPDGYMVVLSATPRHTKRAIENSKRDLRGHGLDLPGL